MPVVCSGRFGGAPQTRSALPPSRYRGGTRLLCPRGLACGLRGKRLLRLQPGGRHLQGQGDQREVPHRPAPRPDLAAADRRPQHGREDRPRGRGHDLDRRQGRRDLLAPVRHPRSPAGTGPARPAGLGAGRRLPQIRTATDAPAASRRASTSAHKTFDLGALKPGATVEAIWKLSAVKAGNYTLLYGIEGGLSGKSKARDRRQRQARRLLRREDRRTAPPNTTVTDSGQIVEIGKPKKGTK